MPETNIVELLLLDFIFDKVKAYIEDVLGLEVVRFPDDLNEDGISASYMIKAKD